MREMQNLSKQINFNNLIHNFKGNNNPIKKLCALIRKLDWYKNINNGYTTLEKEEEGRWNLNQI